MLDPLLGTTGGGKERRLPGSLIQSGLKLHEQSSSLKELVPRSLIRDEQAEEMLPALSNDLVQEQTHTVAA